MNTMNKRQVVGFIRKMGKCQGCQWVTILARLAFEVRRSIQLSYGRVFGSGIIQNNWTPNKGKLVIEVIHQGINCIAAPMKQPPGNSSAPMSKPTPWGLASPSLSKYTPASVPASTQGDPARRW